MSESLECIRVGVAFTSRFSLRHALAQLTAAAASQGTGLYDLKWVETGRWWWYRCDIEAVLRCPADAPEGKRTFTINLTALQAMNLHRLVWDESDGSLSASS